jgi:hypothetical protein
VRAPDASTGAAGRLVAGVVALLVSGCQETVTFVTDGGGGGSGGSPGSCPNGMQVLHPVPEAPEVTFALDRSTAMNAPLGMTDQIGAAQDAIASVFGKYRQIVYFDYVEFPGPSFSCSQGNACCPSQVMPLDSRNLQSVVHHCDSSTPECPISSEHPTGAALEAAAAFYMQSNSGATKRYIVILTDGTPTCGGTGCQENGIVNGLRMPPAFIKTAVLVLGNFDDPCLSEIGNSGGIYNSTSPFYLSAETPDAVTMALDMTVRSIAVQDACKLDFTGGPPDNPDQVTLSLNGPIARGTPDGWQFDDTHTRITLSGNACQMYLDDPNSLTLLGCFHH